MKMLPQLLGQKKFTTCFNYPVKVKFSEKMKFNIYIDRLLGGHVENIEEEVDPAVMKVKDNLLSFEEPIKISGKAYLAEDFLIMNLDIETKYKAPCKICSEEIKKPVEIKGIYLTQELKEIPSRVFDAMELIRDTIFLEIPNYHECRGDCPMRDELKNYFSSNKE